MLAVIKTGGKQYKVKEGDFISVEKLSLDPGAKVEVTDVLMVENNGDVKVGAPYVKNASVSASVIEHKKHKTILIFKKSRRKNYRRKNGHRQIMTILKIDSIKG